MSTVNLFNDIVPESKQNPNYKQIKNDIHKTEIINSWADQAVVDRDGNGKFQKEFQTEFNSCLWELYIYQCLKKIGCKFDLSHNHPDYVVSLPSCGQDFTVECTIASSALGTTPEWDTNAKLNDDVDPDEKVYFQTMRLSNSICSKHNKYIEKYSKEPWVSGKPYIIAVEPFDQPNSFAVGNEAILAALYGELYNRQKNGYEMIDGVYKQNNAEIPLGYFKKPDYRQITGVMFSSVATIGKVDAIGDDPNLTFIHARINLKGTERNTRVDTRNPLLKEQDLKDENVDFSNLYYSFYREKITDGLTLYLNPFAQNPLNNKVLLEMYEAGINIINYDIEQNEFDETLVHDDFLVHRLVLKIN